MKSSCTDGFDADAMVLWDGQFDYSTNPIRQNQHTKVRLAQNNLQSSFGIAL